MNPLETLMDEHRKIEEVLRALASWARSLETGRAAERAELARFVAFIRTYADALHHGKEEDLLFNVMVERGFSREQGPIAVMLEEHREARALTQRMRTLAESPEPWTDEDRTAAIRAARSYKTLLEDHIEKEDQVLYPMADNELTSEDMASLSRSFEIFDNNPENVRSRDEMLALADQLSSQ